MRAVVTLLDRAACIINPLVWVKTLVAMRGRDFRAERMVRLYWLVAICVGIGYSLEGPLWALRYAVIGYIAWRFLSLQLYLAAVLVRSVPKHLESSRRSLVFAVANFAELVLLGGVLWVATDRGGLLHGVSHSMAVLTLQKATEPSWFWIPGAIAF